MSHGRLLSNSSYRVLVCFVALTAFLLLAGCVAPLDPPSQAGPVSVLINNSANATHTFDIYVIEAPPSEAGIALQGPGEDDRITSLDAGSVVANLNPQVRSYTSAHPVPANQSRLQGRYVLEPGEEKYLNVTDFESNQVIAFVIWKDNEVISITSATCTGDLTAVDSFINPYGASGGRGCRI
ncbi:hypothetical protein [Candidatus Halobonum tyrrellensis]|uniref:hypothetical protein n=1 Tax=Candidatus Halobonum tyrrellensis TaxID=1431545 RepID=UPI0012680659|nr:hypothetical protein [Candidatus Halobonum tyrrellensis]